jgi:hypothetical protein
MTRTIDYDLWSTAEPVDVVVTHEYPGEFGNPQTIVHVTQEGVIIDFINEGEVTGTVGMTYDEWFDMSQGK